MKDNTVSEFTAGAQIPVQLQKLDQDLPTPRYAKHGDAGADLYAAEDVSLAPGQRALVPTGVAIALPHGYVGLVHPRSGLALKHGISIVNTPGTIDAGYRGELKVMLINTDPEESVTLKRGDRIAQLVIQPVVEASFVEVDQLPDSDRGATGFGSSGGFGTSDKTVG
ncbi:dUTP diphosphatase [Micrococcoides hystricis]|uniref:Deoxyuridine 5'-triphosphate nucleotidohydrolase n=1 Tax=Micrococcoides hystricis TaxID=1572761 RepID=A0ABV6P738_9MICC